VAKPKQRIQNANEIKFYFYPSESSIKTLDRMGVKGKEDERIILVTEMVRKLKAAMDATGLSKWEITLEGYIEGNTGILPGGKAGFKASVTLSNS